MPVSSPPLLTPFIEPGPNRGQDEDEFDTNQQNFVNSQFNNVIEQNTLAGWIMGAANFTENKASEAEESANAAAESESFVLTTASFKGAWSGLSGSLAVPATVYHNDKYWQLLVSVENVVANEPGVSSAWAVSSQSVGRTEITAPTTIQIPGRYYVKGSGVVNMPSIAGIPGGQTFDLAFQAPSKSLILQTAANGFSTRKGNTDQLLCNKAYCEIVVDTTLNKYRVLA